MKAATHARLRRTAAEAAGSIPGVEAVVSWRRRPVDRGRIRPEERALR